MRNSIASALRSLYRVGYGPETRERFLGGARFVRQPTLRVPASWLYVAGMTSGTWVKFSCPNPGALFIETMTDEDLIALAGKLPERTDTYLTLPGQRVHVGRLGQAPVWERSALEASVLCNEQGVRPAVMRYLAARRTTQVGPLEQRARDED